MRKAYSRTNYVQKIRFWEADSFLVIKKILCILFKHVSHYRLLEFRADESITSYLFL